MPSHDEPKQAAHLALDRLLTGNRRFYSGEEPLHAAERAGRRATVANGQNPIAIVLGCSDSRVPPELVFDQGLGDLFVIRVAGNIVAPSQIASIEFAAESFGTCLTVVLGHTSCGAVRAAIEELRRPSSERSPNLGSIVDRIRPSIEGLLQSEASRDPATLLNEAARANIRASVDQLQRSSNILQSLVERGELLIVGADYSLETGVVHVLDESER